MSTPNNTPSNKNNHNFLDLLDVGAEAIGAILADAIARKAARSGQPKGQPDADAPLAGHTLGMIFEKNSTRTRVYFDMAMRQLGESALILSASEVWQTRIYIFLKK
jgi:ornithine carbamoyltransferase